MVRADRRGNRRFGYLGDPNTLTIDIAASELSQGPSVNTCLVEIEKYTGEAPTVSAFGGPTYVNLQGEVVEPH
nr:hypothetical protein [Suttonella indologenes]